MLDGRIAGLSLQASDGVIDEALLESGGLPFSGTLHWDAAAESLRAVDASGAEVALSDLVVRGQMLQNSSALTAWAFQEGLAPLGDWGNLVVTVCVFLFAVSTMISWSYYGDRCVSYLFGTRFIMLYRLVFIGFIYLGSTTALHVVWAYGDLALGLMSVPNLIAVVLLTPKVVELSRDYFKRMREQGNA